MDCPRIVKGMRDITPPDSARWRMIESILVNSATQFAYDELRTPVLESIDLFKRSVGETTDIVEKEMYAFDDHGHMLCLRPEGTASSVRALLHANTLNKKPEQRLYYVGPMFRRERQQKGRYRQFFQFGIEAFGFGGPDIEVEQIQMVESIWQQLGLQEHIQLEINSLGDPAARQKHREALVAYYKTHYEVLDEDSKRRLERNPLRILDSKNPDLKSLNEAAPKLLDYLEPECKAHFELLCSHLDALGIRYKVNPCLVRGLDYYTRTVFEWTTDKLGSQSTVCAGGHYDALVKQFGGPDTPGCGFALGIDRLVLVHEEVYPEVDLPSADVYWVAAGSEAKQLAWQQAQRLRALLPDLKVIVDCGAEKFKHQFKRADRSQARIACVIGEDELQQQLISVKFLREERAQQKLTFDELVQMLKQKG